MSEALDPWSTVRIGDCCEILDHMRVPINAEERATMPGEVPYYGANGVQDHINAHIFDEPLILLAEDGGYFNEHESRPIAYRVRGKSWVNNHAHVLRVRHGSGRCQDFVFYCLEHKNLMPFIKGGTRAKLNQSELRDVVIPDPPVPQQHRIAEILSTVDEAIEQTERLIAKTQNLKAGLMHDLFTRGVLPDGRLRPPREEAPELYQESVLGWIPVGWGVTDVGSECEITSGITLGPHRRPALNPHPYLRVANVFAERLKLLDIAFLEASPAELLGKTLKSGDLLVVEGHANPKEIGRCALATAEVSGFTFQNHIFRLRPHRMVPSFVVRWMNSHTVRSYWLRVCSTSSGLYTINSAKLRRVPLIFPSETEQKILTSLLDDLVCDIGTNDEYLNKVLALKGGLMYDLLTGRVRVPAGNSDGLPS